MVTGCGERANDDDRDAVSDTASVVPYRISAKHLVTLYWISPISKWVDYQHSALMTNPYQPPFLTFFTSVDYQHSALPALLTNPYQPPFLLTFFTSVDYQHSALVTQMNTSESA